MADIKKTVDIIFGAKSEMSQAISDVERSFVKLDNQAKLLTDPFAKMGEGVLKLDAALAAMVVGGMALAIREAGKFGGSFAEITTLIGDTGAPIDKFRKDILNYSADSVKSIDEINKAIYASISAGVDYTQSVEFVAAAEKLSVAGKSDLGATTKALISTLNAYGEGTDKATKYSDIMFTTVRLGQTTMEELSMQLAKVTGLAANSGVPFETLSAAIAALTVAGLPTEQALTGIKAALQNIIKPTSQSAEMAASLGIQFNAAALQTKGFEGVLWDAWKATGGSTEKMAQLFGSVEALNAVLVLASDKTGKFRDSLAEMNNAAGATETAYKKVADAFENVNTRLVNAAKVALVEIGDRLMPSYSGLAAGMSDMFKGIKIALDQGAFDEVFRVFDQFGKQLSAALKSIAQTMPEALRGVDFKELAEAMRSAGNAIADAFSAGTTADMTEAIQDIVDSVASLISITKGIVEVFVPIISTVREAVQAFNNLDASTKELLGNLMGFSLAYKLLGPWSIALIALGTDAEATGKIFAFMSAAIENGINAVKVAVLSLAMIFAQAAQAAAEMLDYIPGYDASEDIRRTTERVQILGTELNKAQDALATSSDKVWSSLDGTGAAADVATGKVKDLGKEAGKITGEKPLVIAPKLDPLSTSETQWKITQAFMEGDMNRVKILLALGEAEAKEAKEKLREVAPEKKTVSIEVQADGTKIETTKDMIYKTFPDGQVLITNIGTKADEARLAATKANLDEAIPKEKLVEIQAKIDETKIKEQSAIIQKSIEWKAKLDIANVEAQAQKVVAAFKSIDNTITSTGTTLSSITSSFTNMAISGTSTGTGFLESIMRDENNRRSEALDMQKKLTDAEVDNIKARTEAMKRGDSMITINGAGLQPHLEAFMFEILAAIQVRANAEGQKFLVGL